MKKKWKGKREPVRPPPPPPLRDAANRAGAGVRLRDLEVELRGHHT